MYVCVCACITYGVQLAPSAKLGKRWERDTVTRRWCVHVVNVSITSTRRQGSGRDDRLRGPPGSGWSILRTKLFRLLLNPPASTTRIPCSRAGGTLKRRRSRTRARNATSRTRGPPGTNGHGNGAASKARIRLRPGTCDRARPVPKNRCRSHSAAVHRGPVSRACDLRVRAAKNVRVLVAYVPYVQPHVYTPLRTVHVSFI